MYSYSAWQNGANCQAGVTIIGRHLTSGAWRSWGFRQAISRSSGHQRPLAPGGTHPPPGGLEAGGAWHYETCVRRFCCSNIDVLTLDVRDLECFSDVGGSGEA